MIIRNQRGRCTLEPARPLYAGTSAAAVRWDRADKLCAGPLANMLCALEFVWFCVISGILLSFASPGQEAPILMRSRQSDGNLSIWWILVNWIRIQESHEVSWTCRGIAKSCGMLRIWKESVDLVRCQQFYETPQNLMRHRRLDETPFLCGYAANG